MRDSMYAVRHNYLLWLERRFNPLSLTSLSSFYAVFMFFVMSLFSRLDFSVVALFIDQRTMQLADGVQWSSIMTQSLIQLKI